MLDYSSAARLARSNDPESNREAERKRLDSVKAHPQLDTRAYQQRLAAVAKALVRAKP